MKKKDLILTSTSKMTRQDWLAFREPMTHVKQFILSWANIADNARLWNDRAYTYKLLKDVFDSGFWKDFLFPVVGGSEIATIMGLNKYKSIIEMYFEKIGAKDTWQDDNIPMFWGRELEPVIADKWQYWDGSPEGLIMNAAMGNIIRKCRKINFYVQHKSTPWIFVSLDRVINKQGDGIEMVEEGALECKTIVGFVANMWEGGIPPMYVAQLQAQLLSTDMTYGEIAILKDGRYFEVYPFDKHEGICLQLKQQSLAFFDRVKQGISAYLLSKYAPTPEIAADHYAVCEALAPEPDGSEAYQNYLSEKYKEGLAEGILGTISELELAKEYKYFDKRAKDFDALQMERKNKLMAFMKDSSKLELPGGTVTWKKNQYGSRTFRVNVKLEEGYQPASFQLDPARPVPIPVPDDVQVQKGGATRKGAKNGQKRSPAEIKSKTVLGILEKWGKKPAKKTPVKGKKAGKDGK